MENKMYEELSYEELSKLPVIVCFTDEVRLVIDRDNTDLQVMPKYVKSDFYQTSKMKINVFYKPSFIRLENEK